MLAIPCQRNNCIQQFGTVEHLHVTLLDQRRCWQKDRPFEVLAVGEHILVAVIEEHRCVEGGSMLDTRTRKHLLVAGSGKRRGGQNRRRTQDAAVIEHSPAAVLTDACHSREVRG